MGFQVRPYLQFGIDTMIVVMWETTVPATSRVEWGESRLGDRAPNLERSTFLPGNRSMHEVVLSGLTPETKYFWRVVSESESAERIESEHSTTGELKAIAVSSTGAAGRVESVRFRKADPLDPLRRAGTRPGWRYQYYEGDFRSLPDFDRLTLLREGVTPYLDPTGLKDRPDAFGFVFEGFVDIPETGIYSFETYSDDASRLYVAGELVVDNDSEPGKIYVVGQIPLKKGKHPIRVEYFDERSGGALTVSWWGPGVEKQHLREGVISH